MDSKITRTVNGHFADPNSTRDLANITAEELDHIRMSCEAGLLEAETYDAMGDDELRATLERNLRIITGAGLCVPDYVPEVNADVRQFMQVRIIACNTFLRKVARSRGGAIKGITPTEYEHLVVSLQAGYREAEVCCTFSNEQIAEAFANADRIRERLGLGLENPYAAFCGDYFEFFQERSELLWDVLRRVNQPYEVSHDFDWGLHCPTE
jgi:hypothetical protein